jgi:hypothetical protein
MGGREISAIVMLGILLTEAQAHEAPEAEASAHHHVLHLGVMGTALGAATGDAWFAALGGGLFATWIAVPARFELELSAGALATEGGVELSQDILGKIPFHLRPWLHPFIALGPTVAEYIVGGEAPGAAGRHGWGIGGAVSVGADLWLNRRFAFVVEINYNLLYRWLSADGLVAGALVNEIGGSAGALVAF